MKHGWMLRKEPGGSVQLLGVCTKRVTAIASTLVPCKQCATLLQSNVLQLAACIVPLVVLRRAYEVA
jgi:hypothetical protein